ncbi:unnamed protein product [Brassica rapa subsp. narinosa]
MLGLLCFLLDSVGWVPMRSSGFHFQVDEVANTGSLIKLDLSISSRQVIDVIITVSCLLREALTGSVSGKEATEIQQPSLTDVFNHKRGAFALVLHLFFILSVKHELC